MVSAEHKIAYFQQHVMEGHAEVVANQAHELIGPHGISALQLALDAFRDLDDNAVYAVVKALGSKGREAGAAIPSLRAALMFYDLEDHGGSALVARAMLQIDPALSGDGFVARCAKEGMQRAEAALLVDRWSSPEALRRLDEFINYERRERPYQIASMPGAEELREFRDLKGPTKLGVLFNGPFAVLYRQFEDDIHLITADPQRYARPEEAMQAIDKLLKKLGPNLKTMTESVP